MRRWLREAQDTAHGLRLVTELFIDDWGQEGDRPPQPDAVQRGFV